MYCFDWTLKVGFLFANEKRVSMVDYFGLAAEYSCWTFYNLISTLYCTIQFDYDCIISTCTASMRTGAGMHSLRTVTRPQFSNDWNLEIHALITEKLLIYREYKPAKIQEGKEISARSAGNNHTRSSF